jgi:predicted HTH domain antitoxin
MPNNRYREVADMATKTLSIRINDDDYKFLSSLAKEERGDMSTAVRELVDLGRVMLAVEKYKKGEASLEKAARLAGVSLSKMMDVLAEYGVEANLEYEDYLKGLKSIRKVW